mgnify:CR=1 FL=1
MAAIPTPTFVRPHDQEHSLRVDEGDVLERLRARLDRDDIDIIDITAPNGMHEELAVAGLVPGYLSPLHADQRVRVVVDDAVAKSNNLVYGANEVDHHLINGNFGRDYYTRDVADIALTRDEKICLQCGGVNNFLYAGRAIGAP